MQDEDLGEPVDGHVLDEPGLFLAARAFISRALHYFWFHEVLEQRLHRGVASHPDGRPLNVQAQVLKGVEGEGIVATPFTVNSIYELALEEVGDGRVFLVLEVLPPLRRLLVHRQVVHIHFFVLLFAPVPVHLHAHAVQEEPQELLCVLLAIPTEPRAHLRHLVLERIRRHQIIISPHLLQERVVGVRERRAPGELVCLELGTEVGSEVGRRENALQNGVHETRVADVTQTHG